MREDEQLPHQLRNGVTMIDRNVRDALLFVNHTAKRMPTGQMQVRVQMQNIYRDEALWSDMRVVFYDADQIAVDQTEWRMVEFPPHEVVPVEGKSLRNDVQAFNIQFKGLKSRSGRMLSPPDVILEHDLWTDSVLPE